MPELPEVETTAKILNTLVCGRKIIGVWTDYDSPYFYGKENIKDPKYFRKFARSISGRKILRVWRRAKNVLIDIDGEQTILVHMKMTGHLLYGRYKWRAAKAPNKKASGRGAARPNTTFSNSNWQPVNMHGKHDKESPLADPFNRFIHLIFELDNGRSIAFSDMRKFATVKLISDRAAFAKEFAPIGPEPLDTDFKLTDFKKLMKEVARRKKTAPVKTVLMDPFVISGIGNIYSDEILWASRVRPDRWMSKVSDSEWVLIFKNMKKLLARGILFGGDSMSDYRNPYGLPGKFQNEHQVYQRRGENCTHRGCGGKIERKIIGARSTHYCPVCQK